MESSELSFIAVYFTLSLHTKIRHDYKNFTAPQKPLTLSHIWVAKPQTLIKHKP